MRRLFELEVTEVADGTVKIEAFARAVGQTKRTFFRLGYGFSRSRNGAANTGKQWEVTVDKKRKPELFVHLMRKNKWKQVLVFCANNYLGLASHPALAAAAAHGIAGTSARPRCVRHVTAACHASAGTSTRTHRACTEACRCAKASHCGSAGSSSGSSLPATTTEPDGMRP